MLIKDIWQIILLRIQTYLILFILIPKRRFLVWKDPKFVYFLRNIIWHKFAREIGFKAEALEFKSQYDFALSFSGSDRIIAEKIRNLLVENEVQVFYDKDEEHRILAKNGDFL